MKQLALPIPLRYLPLPILVAVPLYVLIGTSSTQSPRVTDLTPTNDLQFDAYSEGIRTVLFDATGEISYTLDAERQIHLQDDSSDLEKPRISFFGDDASQWNIAADSGRISPQRVSGDSRSRELQFSGNVELVHLEGDGERMRLFTERLLIDTQNERASTELPVRLQTASIQHSAVGMQADLRQNVITFNRRSVGRYDP